MLLETKVDINFTIILRWLYLSGFGSNLGLTTSMAINFRWNKTTIWDRSQAISMRAPLNRAWNHSIGQNPHFRGCKWPSPYKTAITTALCRWCRQLKCWRCPLYRCCSLKRATFRTYPIIILVGLVTNWASKTNQNHRFLAESSKPTSIATLNMPSIPRPAPGNENNQGTTS